MVLTAIYKEFDRVAHAYLVNVYSKIGRSLKILSENGTKFKNKLFVQVASTLGMKQVFSSTYYPSGNGCI